MKNILRYLILLTVAVCSLQSQAVPSAKLDTVYFYKSWEQMLNLQPTAYIVNPITWFITPYEMVVETGDEGTNDMIKENYMALSIGDSIWLINSEYLRKNFKGVSKNISEYAPVFFNDKVAYVTAPGPLGVKDLLFGTESDGVTYYGDVAFYYIDFKNHRVERVTHSYLSELLEDYHDLQMRYEGMKNNKDKRIIEDYFYKYVDRATDDIMRPFIVDLVEN